MKILFVNLSDYPIPPPPTIIRADTYVSVPLAQKLQDLGHDVYFLCSPGSTVNTKKLFTNHPPLSSVMTLNELMTSYNNPREVELAFWFDTYFTLIEQAKKNDFDLIHFHTNTPLTELTALQRLNTPCVFTLHSYPQFPQTYAKFFDFFNKRTNNYFVSISDYQQTKFNSTRFIRTVHNGLDIQKFLFDATGGKDMLFAGRLVKEKGIKEAVLLSEMTKKPLVITGSVDPSTLRVNEKDFYTSEVTPVLDRNKDLIRINTTVDRNAMYSFYKGGRLTLVPILWDEPFGLVMTESMAMGTPVVAFAKGSVPEIIKDGVTGFIVNASDDDIRGSWIVKKTGIEGLREAVERIYSMNEGEYSTMRRACRRHVEENFTIERMVEKYVQVYNEILAKKP